MTRLVVAATDQRTVAEASLSIARHAVASLHFELVLYPKPGLVSPIDAGAHDDMDVRTFMRSLFALRGFFVDVAEAGAREESLAVLRDIGVRGEARMVRATGGVNTHRGAIFTLGYLAAAAGAVQKASGRHSVLSDRAIKHALQRWQTPRADTASTQRTPGASASHGQIARQRFGSLGARGEAAAGFPHVFELALPTLRRALAAGSPVEVAAIDVLFHLIVSVEDTNLLYRAGRSGLAYAQRAAFEFLRSGGIRASGGPARALAVHRDFCARRLSPGGAADLLAAAVFVHRLQAQR